ncbi:EexN family lipoprotein [Psychrobacter sp. UBA3480]|uniref:EexN family lipoprotein n=1 Tax=Psychrobacter sp. UBA3480 TaxID=1947350 RepID=UPI0025F80AD7|nr:EexN family lipoprotein [Psychrobacter sp. UBA3480]
MKLLNTAVAVGLSLTMLALTGCGEEELRNSSYYSKNPDELKSTLQKCRAESDKGNVLEGNMKKNCSTANTVARNRMMAAIRN